MLKRISKGVVPVFFTKASYGTMYTPDLARYMAMATVSVPDAELNSYVDVGWSTPVNGDTLAAAFSKVLGNPFTAKPAVPDFVFAILSFFAMFIPKLKDMVVMVRWVNTGVYVSKDTARQQKLFGDLPTIEEAVRRYCKDNNLIK